MVILALFGQISAIQRHHHHHHHHRDNSLVQMDRTKDVSNMVSELSQSSDDVERIIDEEQHLGQKHKKKLTK